MIPPFFPPGSSPQCITSFCSDLDYEYSFGSYRGGYPDPYYNGFYSYAGSDYFYDYPVRGGRGRPPPNVRALIAAIRYWK